MSRSGILFVLCLPFISMLYAGNRYVSVSGNDTNNGLSWQTAMATVDAAMKHCQTGDTLFCAAGDYYQTLSIPPGITLLGGMDIHSDRNTVSRNHSVFHGCDKPMPLLTAEGKPEHPIRIANITLCKAAHNARGGGAILKGNVNMHNCTIYQCRTTADAGGVWLSDGACLEQSLVELCEAGGDGGAIYNQGGIVSHCIIRGNRGKKAAVCNTDGGKILNCLIYNNEASTPEWPSSGGIYNPDGLVVHCTIACNAGAKYAGLHSDSNTLYSVCWNNTSEEGFGDPPNFISDTCRFAGNNAADKGFEAQHFPVRLAESNTATNGPHFNAPSCFTGVPSSETEIKLMRHADFTLLPESPCIDQAVASAVPSPATDITGRSRIMGKLSDIGAFEYNPQGTIIQLESLLLLTDTLLLVEGEDICIPLLFVPDNTTCKQVEEEIGDTLIANCKDGRIYGRHAGQTNLTVRTNDGKIYATAVVKVKQPPLHHIHPLVQEADSLYRQKDYTIPSFTTFLVAKEAARANSSDTHLHNLRQRIDLLQDWRYPYCEVASINGSPATSMGFTWFTNSNVTEGVLQIVPIGNAMISGFDNALEFSCTVSVTPSLRYAVSTSGILKAAALPPATTYTYASHKALATELQPATTYLWRVGTEGHWSATHTFTTAPQTGQEYTFLYLTDSHIQDQEYVDNALWCSTAACKNIPEARFLIFPGDFVETGGQNNSEWEWEQWCDIAMRPLLHRMPVAPTDGNHDDSGNLNYTFHFNTDTAFARSASVKPQFSGGTYSFVYGNTLFLVFSMQDWWRGTADIEQMNSAYLQNALIPWMQQQVAQHADTKWRIAVMHKNLFAGSGHQSDADGALFRNLLLPVFRELEIDFAIQGHDHCYEVIGPVGIHDIPANAVHDVTPTSIDTITNIKGQSGGTFVTDEGTLFFVGATCGRKQYNPYTSTQMQSGYPRHRVPDYWNLFTGRFGQPCAPTYSAITVSEEQITIKAYTADSSGNSTLFDTYRIIRTRPHTTPFPASQNAQ